MNIKTNMKLNKQICNSNSSVATTILNFYILNKVRFRR